MITGSVCSLSHLNMGGNKSVSRVKRGEMVEIRRSGVDFAVLTPSSLFLNLPSSIFPFLPFIGGGGGGSRGGTKEKEHKDEQKRWRPCLLALLNSPQH